MKPKNLISIYQGDAVVEALATDKDNKRFMMLKKHEIRNMRSFCSIMMSEGCSIGDLNGFFVSYTISQIGKEFDLLRFGDGFILNIEIKSELKVAKKELKILKQMQQNYYYLKFLGRPIQIFSYVENDGFYRYDCIKDAVESVSAQMVVQSIKEQIVDYTVDPDKVFIPSNYLISPFNSTEQFIGGEYFLTGAQQNIKDEIYEELRRVPFKFFCISANAGTGKTLLMYDIAKGMIASSKKVKIVHCGKLNDGHLKLLNDYGWDIVSIRQIPSSTEHLDLEGYDYIFVDESQRIRDSQLRSLIEVAVRKEIAVFFSFDTKQYLREGETLDVNSYLAKEFPGIPVSAKKLTNRIRTNKAMASFVKNLLNFGKSKDYLNYDCVTIEYMDDFDMIKSYISFLENEGWTPITYTTSKYDLEPYCKASWICERNAHDVIGQEFSKVVFVMDENFWYDEQGTLRFNRSYYSAGGMLYQIVTRVVDELKIVVTNNPELYVKLLGIKFIGQSQGLEK